MIQKIVFIINGKTIELTEDEAKEMKSSLDKLFGQPTQIISYPWYPSYPSYPSYTTSGAFIEYGETKILEN